MACNYGAEQKREELEKRVEKLEQDNERLEAESGRCVGCQHVGDSRELADLLRQMTGQRLCVGCSATILYGFLEARQEIERLTRERDEWEEAYEKAASAWSAAKAENERLRKCGARDCGRSLMCPEHPF